MGAGVAGVNGRVAMVGEALAGRIVVAQPVDQLARLDDMSDELPLKFLPAATQLLRGERSERLDTALDEPVK